MVWALAGAGAAEVVVVPGRDRRRAARTAAVAGPVGRVGIADEVAKAEIVVNATPLGLDADRGSDLAVDPVLLGPGQVVVDLVPRPTTPLLEAAATRGAQTVDGLGMLVHQAALALRLWTGCEPPLDVMRAAVRS